jgi:quercetin dioxygenase-like cupin family protein
MNNSLLSLFLHRAAVAWICTSSLGCATVQAKQGSSANDQVERKVIERGEIAGTDEELDLILVTFPPGAASPAHYHPVVGLNYILEGVAESQYEGEALKTYVAGQSYQDQANRKHLIYRNKSLDKPLRFLIAFKIKKGIPFKIDL